MKSAVPADSVLLMEWYADINYRGYIGNVYGDYGNCDREGYRISVPSWAHDEISSFKTFSYCTGIWAYQKPKQKGAAALYLNDNTSLQITRVPDVGDFMNDHIASFQIWNSI